MKSFEQWLLDTYEIEDFDEFLKEYDIDGHLTERVVKEWRRQCESNSDTR